MSARMLALWLAVALIAALAATAYRRAAVGLLLGDASLLCS
jgi:hypothetical protein